MIAGFSSSGSSCALKSWARRPTSRRPAPLARRLRTQWVCPRAATRYRVPSTVNRLTGVRRGSPLLRPRTSSTRDPATLTPARVSSATAGLKMCRVNQPGR